MRRETRHRQEIKWTSWPRGCERVVGWDLRLGVRPLSRKSCSRCPFQTWYLATTNKQEDKRMWNHIHEACKGFAWSRLDDGLIEWVSQTRFNAWWCVRKFRRWQLAILILELSARYSNAMLTFFCCVLMLFWELTVPLSAVLGADAHKFPILCVATVLNWFCFDSQQALVTLRALTQISEIINTERPPTPQSIPSIIRLHRKVLS